MVDVRVGVGVLAKVKKSKSVEGFCKSRQQFLNFSLRNNQGWTKGNGVANGTHNQALFFCEPGAFAAMAENRLDRVEA